jgi:transcriptional regulator with XRE-family HTH domain
MTPDELRAALTELGWSAPHLARLLGVGEKTPTNWLLGRAKVPEDVGEWIEGSLSVFRWGIMKNMPRAAAGKERCGE